MPPDRTGADMTSSSSSTQASRERAARRSQRHLEAMDADRVFRSIEAAAGMPLKAAYQMVPDYHHEVFDRSVQQAREFAQRGRVEQNRRERARLFESSSRLAEFAASCVRKGR
jgi:hypothetical protein